MYYEWDNEFAAMKDALNTISCMILDLKKCEKTAKMEAEQNIKLCKENLLTKAELIDRLQQSVIDFNANKT